MSHQKLNVKSPFDVEKHRHKLAMEGNARELILTYKGNLPEIKNLNTGQMWDRLNMEAFGSFQLNPMACDRIKTAVGYIDKAKKGLSILDIGFGSGDFERLASNKHLENAGLIGLDISSNSVRRAQKEFPYWKFIRGSIERADIGSRSFDYIIALEVLEHVSPKHIFGVLSKIRGVLKNDGKLIVSIPLNEGLEKLIKSGSNPNAHVRAYTRELIEAELGIVGFQVVKRNFLYAFHKGYRVKTLAARLLGLGKKPNNVILLVEKV